MARPVTVGLTGGVASGKSTIASMFLRLGAVVLDADQVGHQVLGEQAVKTQIHDHWGSEMFLDDGTINRKALAKIVFAPQDNGKQLEILEKITHPRIKDRILEQIGQAEESGAEVVVLDAPLLFEAGWDQLCDELVFVHANREDRIERIQRRGWTVEQFENREKQQLSLKEKERRSGHFIDNSEALEQVFEQVQRLWDKLTNPVSESTDPNPLGTKRNT